MSLTSGAHGSGRTAALEAFVVPARRRPALWRTLVGTLVAGALWLFIIGFCLALASPLGGAATRAGLLLFLGSFAGLLAGVVLAAAVLQCRGPGTLIGPGGLRPRAFCVGVAAAAAAAMVAGPLTLAATAPTQQMSLATWAAWLPLALPAVLLQSAAEEVAFRGFLMQSLAARFASPLAWWLGPALLFGLLHWNPQGLGANAWLGVVATTAIGLLLADVTRATGNLSAAIGLHFANNVMAMLVVAMPSPVSSLALFVAEVAPGETVLARRLMLADLGVTLAAWALWRVIAARRRLQSQDPDSI